MAALFSFYTFVVILAAILLAHLSPPNSPSEIERVCGHHGRVVSYSGTGFFNENATVVCSDGKVFRL